MKKQFFIYTILILSLVFTGCSDDDPPAPVNEEEVITTMTITLTPSSGADIVLKHVDMDAEGPDDPIVTVDGVETNQVTLATGTTYTGSIELLNETEDPAEDITEEVAEDEADEHQFFYVIGSELDVTTAYTDQDEDGKPIGVEFTLTANSISSGDLTFILRHEPNKSADGVADGDIENAGGETDIEETFSISVE
ncbi:MAG: type 1 periplasmic binding fold superfamily protein [Flavobacteriaceae bacterium]|nr:type 1 periplasmic binding fold superfamily protein [Flavobacteriaceae bacterium]